MADIKINDIQPAGAELFDDNESFMDEISNNELSRILGGKGLTLFGNCHGDVTIFGNCHAR
jgi:hypothetical protein